MTGFHHLALTVHDLDASASWYERLFNLELVSDEPGDERRASVYRLRGTTQLLGLVEHRGNDGAEFRPDRIGLDHAAFSVPTRAEVDAWAQRLDVAGIEHSGRIDIPLGAILNFTDPDGIALVDLLLGGLRCCPGSITSRPPPDALPGTLGRSPHADGSRQVLGGTGMRIRSSASTTSPSNSLRASSAKTCSST